MKQISFISSLLVAIGGFFYINHTAPFNKHISDAIHFPKNNAFFEKADAYKYAQDFAQACTAFEVLLPTSKHSEDSIYIYNQLIYCQLAMNNDSLAAEWLQKLEKNCPTVENAPPSVSSDYFYNKGVFAYRTFHTKEAEMYLNKALLLYQSQTVYGEQHLKTALCLTKLGMLHYEFAQTHDSAFKYIPRAYALFQQNEALKPFSAECELGMSFVSLIKRDYDGTIAHCAIALAVLSKMAYQDTVLMARCMSTQATGLRKNSQFEEDAIKRKSLRTTADSLYKKAIYLGQNKPNIRIEEFYRDMIVSKLRDSSQFWLYLNELKKVLTDLPDRYGKPDRLEALYFDFKRDAEKALPLYKKVLDSYLKDSVNNRLLILEAYSRLSEIYYNKKDYNTALTYCENALKYGTVYEGKKMSLAQLTHPNFYREKSLLFYDYGILARILLAKSKLKKDDNLLETAFQTFNLTDKLLFSGILSADENSTSVYQEEVARDVYNGAIECAELLYNKTTNKTKKAEYLHAIFIFCERPKSFLLFKNRDLEMGKIPKPNQKIVEEIKALNYKITKEKWDNINKEKWDNANAIEMTASQIKLDSLTDYLKQKYPDYHQFKVIQPIEIIDSIKTQLGTHRTLIEFKCSEDKLYIFVINGQKSDVFIEPIDSSFDKLTKNFKKMVANSEKVLVPLDSFKQVASALYVKIFRQVPTSYFHQKELYIVPDGVLNELPFEALLKPSKKQAKHFKELPYWVLDNPIAYAPSWKILSQTINFKLSENPRFIAYQYADRTRELPYSNDTMKSLRPIWQHFTVRYVDDLPNPQSQLIKDMANCDILHFSLHASSSSTNKLDNTIYLKTGFQAPLHGFDLLDKPLKAQLIVLSACETAKGKTEMGEGVFSLSRSFIQIGAKCLVSSFWKNDEAATSSLLSHFYRHLQAEKSEKSIIRTLQASKIALIQAKNPVFSRPKYWAGMNLIY